jgi:hypothetical protein
MTVLQEQKQAERSTGYYIFISEESMASAASAVMVIRVNVERNLCLSRFWR